MLNGTPGSIDTHIYVMTKKDRPRSRPLRVTRLIRPLIDFRIDGFLLIILGGCARLTNSNSCPLSSSSSSSGLRQQCEYLSG